jgi:hypothetical protein
VLDRDSDDRVVLAPVAEPDERGNPEELDPRPVPRVRKSKANAPLLVDDREERSRLELFERRRVLEPAA